MTIYAIGDIHGHLGLLHAAHARIDADRARTGADDAPVIHIGDLVDRGPNSAGVVDYLAKATAEDPRIIVLMGNHDYMFTKWLNTAPARRGSGGFNYLSSGIGGLATLASYGVDTGRSERHSHEDALARVPDTHRAFLEALPYTHEAGDCLFVHAGIRPGVALADQEAKDLIWIRDLFLLHISSHGPLVVHGHTPTASGEVEDHGNRLGIDTGAAYGGPLSAVAIEGREVFLLTQNARIPVRQFAP